VPDIVAATNAARFREYKDALFDLCCAGLVGQAEIVEFSALALSSPLTAAHVWLACTEHVRLVRSRA
jgi:hypothetical protein